MQSLPLFLRYICQKSLNELVSPFNFSDIRSFVRFLLNDDAYARISAIFPLAERHSWAFCRDLLSSLIVTLPQVYIRFVRCRLFIPSPRPNWFSSRSARSLRRVFLFRQVQNPLQGNYVSKLNVHCKGYLIIITV